MSAISGASGSQGAGSVAGQEQTNRNRQQLDSSDFMNLLITQLRYQDPMKPMDDREFMAQLAQFSTLERVTEQTRWSKMTYGLGLVGQQVTYGAEDGAVRTDRVLAMRVVQGEPRLVLGSDEIPLDRVIAASGV